MSRFLVILSCCLFACSSRRGRGGGDDDVADGDADADGGEGEGEIDPVSDEQACEYAASSHSYEGCDYIAVDLPNYPFLRETMELAPADSQYAVVISNGDDRSASRVRVLSYDDGEEREIESAEVAPRRTHVFELPPGTVSETGLSGHAYRIVASRPVTAYQFNPLNNTDEAFSNDASLLIPTSALGSEYVAVTPDAGGAGEIDGVWSNMGAFVAVVAVDEPVEVTVRPAVPLAPGGGIAGGSDDVVVTLQPFEVLNLQSLAEDWATIPPVGQGNLSGTRVRADGPIAVFAGAVCSIVPTGPEGSCCCDHMEEQMFPLSSLGSKFVGAPSWDRAEGRRQPDYWRLTAGETAVTLEWVDRPSGAPTSLDALESAEFEAAEPFVVSGDGRLQLVQFLTSSNQVAEACETDYDCGGGVTDICWQGRCLVECEPARDGDDCPYLASCLETEDGYAFCEAMGDPAMILVPPVEQYRSDYVFLTPDDYAHDFVTVVAPEGTTVELDGMALEGFHTAGEIDGEAFVWVSTELESDGTHVVTAGSPVALIVYGYDRYVSYGYPAGLDLEELFF